MDRIADPGQTPLAFYRALAWQDRPGKRRISSRHQTLFKIPAPAGTNRRHSFSEYRIASVFLVVINIRFLFFPVVFLFLIVIFFIRLFSKQDFGAYVAISIEVF